MTAGRATFTVGGDEIDAPAGTVVFVRDPAAQREALGDGGRHDRARRRRPPRRGLSARAPGRRTSDVDAAVGGGPTSRRIKRADARRARSATRTAAALLYNLACAEAQLGETDAALEHLAAAIAERPDLARERARGQRPRPDPRGPALPGLAVETHQPVREAVLFDVADVPEARPSRRRATSGGSAPRRWRRPRVASGSAKTTSRANCGEDAAAPSPTADELGLADHQVDAGGVRADLDELRPLRVVVHEVGLDHPDWAGRRPRIANCRVGRRPLEAGPALRRSPLRWASRHQRATCSSPSQSLDEGHVVRFEWAELD